MLLPFAAGERLVARTGVERQVEACHQLALSLREHLTECGRRRGDDVCAERDDEGEQLARVVVECGDEHQFAHRVQRTIVVDMKQNMWTAMEPLRILP